MDGPFVIPTREEVHRVAGVYDESIFDVFDPAPLVVFAKDLQCRDRLTP